MQVFVINNSSLALLDKVFHTIGFIDTAILDVVNGLVHSRLCLSLQRYGGYPSQHILMA